MGLENYEQQEVRFGYLRNNQDTLYLKENESSDTFNFELFKDTQIGTLARRPDVTKLVYSGSVDAAPSANPVLGFFHSPSFDGTKYFAYAINGKVYYHNGTASPDEIKTGLGSSNIVRFARFVDDKVYIVNLNDAMFVWDPASDATTTSVASGSPPNSQLIEEHKSHLFLGMISGAEGTIRYCEFEDAAVWTVTNDFQFNDKINGMISHANILVAFTASKTHLIEGDNSNNFGVSTLDDGSGCIAPFSVVTAQGSVFFCSHNGFKVISSLNPPVLISGDVQSSFNLLRDTSLENIQGTYDYIKEEVVWGCNLTGTDNDIATVTLFNAFFIYELKTGKFKIRLVKDGFGRTLGQYINSNGAITSAFGNDVGRINFFDAFTGSDFIDHSTTATQDLKYVTAPLDQGDRRRIKKYNKFRLFVKPASGDTLTIKFKTDRLAQVSKVIKLDRTPYRDHGQAFLDALEYVPVDVDLLTEGTYIMFEITNAADSTADINLMHGVLFYTFEGIESNLEETT